MKPSELITGLSFDDKALDFLKSEVTKLQELNAKLEYEKQIAYSIGYNEGSKGRPFDKKFSIDRV